MEFISPEQIWGISMFFLGAGILDWCSRMERKEDEWHKDPRNKYKKNRRKRDFIIPTTVRGVMMSFSGSLLSLAGITLFFLHIK